MRVMFSAASWALASVFALAASAQPAEVGPEINLRKTVVVDVVRKTKDAVVNVSTTKVITRRVSPFGADPFWQQFDFGGEVMRIPANSLGSGFIIHPDGWILTSGHVIARTRDTAALEKELLRNGAISALLKHFPVDELRRLYRGEALEQHVLALASEGTIDHESIVNEVELSNGEKMAFKINQYDA